MDEIRSTDKELKALTLTTIDQLNMLEPSKLVVNTKGETVEIPDKDFEGYVKELDILLKHEEERRKLEQQAWQMGLAIAAPMLVLALASGARCLVQTPFWKDWMRMFEKMSTIRL